jgi:branched-chain amino acid transport system substrate-binding protein
MPIFIGRNIWAARAVSVVARKPAVRIAPLKGSPRLRKLSSKTALAGVMAAALLVPIACGSDQSRGGRVQGDTLTVFSSLPLQGVNAERARSIVNAEKLALRDAGGKAGDFTINFASADDATARDGDPGWDPDRTAENARTAVENQRTIAYVGDFDSGASAISLPITNEAGFVQVSPGSTAVGLTKLVPGAESGEPDKYYPSGDRTFARVVPADDVQSSAAAAWARKLGVKSVFLLGDRAPEGDGQVQLFRAAAKENGGPTEVGQDRADPRATDYRDLAKDIAKTKPDAIYYGGAASTNALRLWRDLHDANPDALLLGSDELLVPEFYGRIGAAADKTYLTSVAQDPKQLPPQGRSFLARYARTYAEVPDPYAAYGYTTMSLLLDAIERAGSRGNERDQVIRETFDTRHFRSPIGTFSIDDNGDTSLLSIAGYRIRNGKPVFSEALRGEAKG